MSIFSTIMKTFAVVWVFYFTAVFVVRPTRAHIELVEQHQQAQLHKEKEHLKKVEREKQRRKNCKGRWCGEAPICELDFFRELAMCN